MKLRLFYILAILVSSAVLSFADVLKEDPKAGHKNGVIVLSWITVDESNVREFKILRRNGTSGDFVELAVSIAPKGSSSTYEFEDAEAFKAAGGVYQYLVRVVFTGGTFADSKITTVSSVASAAKRTWGSIKAMFR
jgi:hypothetical protein